MIAWYLNHLHCLRSICTNYWISDFFQLFVSFDSGVDRLNGAIGVIKNFSDFDTTFIVDST